MNYCPKCRKLVNANEEKNDSYYFSLKFWLIIGFCTECNSFLYQYLEEKK